LISPSSLAIRPTSDRVREALFNILRAKLGNDFSSMNLLDVFTGSGAFGCEAISQGFGKVTLVDIDLTDASKNIALFPNEKNRIELIKGDACKIVCGSEKFDVIFMDAPYNKGLTEKSLENIKTCLKKGALCLIEVEKNEICNLPQEYKKIDERKYGLAKVILAEFEG
jgi:16S rRNA (guanine966-N2)-methyltransferase